jgi:predicted neutral ceramidase superfamily lipid hydrolase
MSTNELIPGFFLVQSIIIYTLGIKLYQVLYIDNNVAAIVVCFFVTLAASAGGAEIFYRIVDVPSHVSSHLLFDWMRV